MRKLVLACALFSFIFAFGSDEKEPKPTSVGKIRTYVVGILKTGPTAVQDSLKKAEMLESHVEFLKKLNEEGKLFASGSLSADPASRGLYIFNVQSVKEAMAIMNKDESVASGWVSLDYHVWKTRDYSAPEPMVNESSSEKESGGLKLTTNVILIGVFTIIIIVLMLRTFRMKPDV